MTDATDFIQHYGVLGMQWGKSRSSSSGAKDNRRLPMVRQNPNPTSREIITARGQKSNAKSDLVKTAQRFKEDHPSPKLATSGRTEALKQLREKEAKYNEIKRVGKKMTTGEKFVDAIFDSKNYNMNVLVNDLVTAPRSKPGKSRYK